MLSEYKKDTKKVENFDGNIVYYINKNKRIVYCKRFVNKYEMFNFAEKFLGITGFSGNFSEKSITLKPEYVGVAKCHIDDVWDEEKGKKIALNKALFIYHRDKLDAFRSLLNITQDLHEDMIEICEKQDKFLCKKFKDLNIMVNS